MKLLAGLGMGLEGWGWRCCLQRDGAEGAGGSRAVWQVGWWPCSRCMLGCGWLGRGEARLAQRVLGMVP